MVARPGCWSRICISGRAPSGSGGSGCSTRMSRASGRAWATAPMAQVRVFDHAPGVVARCVVGTERLSNGYSRAKLAQEKLIKESGIPYSIVHATQFFEFVKRIADSATDGNTVRLSHALIQPIAADAVASTLARTAVGEPINGTIEIAGPEQFGLDELIRKGLSFRGDPREVVADPEARYFGALLEERTLLPSRTPSSSTPASRTGLLKPHHRTSPGRGRQLRWRPEAAAARKGDPRRGGCQLLG
jgi:uncharacterized protein YbjT (DUF2867 family)